ncbi:hypothetical protein AKJ18_04695 [Vibrio xuii]|nr:hypothetical protein AKJ18_04695 [Vibrio xuii]
MQEEYAPVVIFCYNRLSHLRVTLEALSKDTYSQYSNLYIFSDGAKGVNDYDSVQELRDFLSEWKKSTCFANVSIKCSDSNKGLANNIIEGVTSVINTYGKVIVLEDDIKVLPGFLQYMNESLKNYEHDFRVWQISSHLYPVGSISEPKLIPFSNCWGWATWKNRWEHFSKKPEEVYSCLENQDVRMLFNNLSYTKDYYKQVVNNYTGRSNTWAIFWYSTIFNHNGLTLYPPKVLSTNIGMDESGVHCSKEGRLMNSLEDDISYQSIKRFPTQVDYKYYFRVLLFIKNNQPSLIYRVWRRIRKYVK